MPTSTPQPRVTCALPPVTLRLFTLGAPANCRLLPTLPARIATLPVGKGGQQ